MFYITLVLAKITYKIIKLTKFKGGNGSTWPGHLALKLYPNILSNKKFKYKKGIILITGTNGKTTTSKLISHLFASCGYKVAHNRAGSNLLNGLVSALLLDMSFLGIPKSDAAVLEVDEFTLPLVLSHLSPSILLLLNLSRDQLDRYGEIDIIFDRWKQSVSTLSDKSVLVMDSEQQMFKDLLNVFNGRVFYFDSDPSHLERTKLSGNFNAKNINASLLVGMVSGLDPLEMDKSLENFEAAYGRGEVITYRGKNFQMFLAKNPASFNENLSLVNSGNLNHNTLVFVLNDKPVDGRDVSWIYDIDPRSLAAASVGKKIYVSGTRYLDMAIRLYYAGIILDEDNISNDLEHILNKVTRDETSQDVLILPNYSSMLESREVMLGRRML